MRDGKGPNESQVKGFASQNIKAVASAKIIILMLERQKYYNMVKEEWNGRIDETSYTYQRASIGGTFNANNIGVSSI